MTSTSSAPTHCPPLAISASCRFSFVGGWGGSIQARFYTWPWSVPVTKLLRFVVRHHSKGRLAVMKRCDLRGTRMRSGMLHERAQWREGRVWMMHDANREGGQKICTVSLCPPQSL
jgi:hypothetical protein